MIRLNIKDLSYGWVSFRAAVLFNYHRYYLFDSVIQQRVNYSNWITPQFSYYHGDYIMLQIPPKLIEKYHILLRQNGVPAALYHEYIKWLQFYLDFCKKYNRSYADSGSLNDFLTKLKQKNQSAAQRQQAVLAIELYYSGLSIPLSHTSIPLPHTIDREHLKETTRAYQNRQKNTDWDSAIQSLTDEIRLRHYSPKTLKAYSLWAKKLRYHSENKPPLSLTPDDVKVFLTHLAVDKNVSASSQNQAFNALLFFFRHVLKKEFGKIDGVVRAKRKPYIPVVLSREEVDAVIRNLIYPNNLVVRMLYGSGGKGRTP